jgi:hypothetical protein
MRFDWDPAKADANRTKHGVEFTEAARAFDDPFALVAHDETHSTLDEVRWWLIGEADESVLVVVFTIRPPDDVRRLISARRANRRERYRYEESKRVPI